MTQETLETHIQIDRLLDYLVGEFSWATASADRWIEVELLSFVREQPLHDEAMDELQVLDSSVNTTQ